MPQDYPDGGILYMAAGPIGNLGDITLRTVEVLKTCDAVACEDTRRTGVLLQHLGISKRLLSCRADNEEASARGISALLAEGQTVVYLSDAGTPGVSDPGSRLVRVVAENGFTIRPLPGPSALTALLSVCPFGGRAVTFDGFLPPKSAARKKRLTELLERDESFLFYEAPHRIETVLKELSELAPERPVQIGREMTKLFEEYPVGTADGLLQKLRETHTIKGEFAVFVAGKEAEKRQKKRAERL